MQSIMKMVYGILALSLCLTLALAAATRAGEAAAGTQVATPPKSGPVDFETASEIALKLFENGGQITEMDMDFDLENGKIEYKFQIESDGFLFDVKIDAATGRVLKFEREGPSA